MSFTDNTGTAIFPTNFISQCVETYTKRNGKAPKLLVVNTDDYLDYQINRTIASARGLGLEVTYGDYLKKGEIDLAMGIKNKP
jgi:hypothetical protein